MGPIELAGFEPEGVTLACADDPDFDRRAQQILQGCAAPVLDLKPCLAIVSNRSRHTIVAYTICWAATLRNQSTEFHRTQFKYPDAVAGNGSGLSLLRSREIRPGEDRLVGMGFDVWPPAEAQAYRQFGWTGARRLAEMTSLKISLDAVIFENGGMLGPDESHLAEHFIAFLQAKQSQYRQAVSILEDHDLLDDPFAALRKLLDPRQTPPTDPLAVYDRMAASELLSLHNRVVQEVFRRSLRTAPFRVSRLSGTSG